ncbi:MAG: hypothetical protein RMJ98_16060 [Myxococcales bacterium]|nr:hypothetical protein [Myxococcales bacterium]
MILVVWGASCASAEGDTGADSNLKPKKNSTGHAGGTSSGQGGTGGSDGGTKGTSPFPSGSLGGGGKSGGGGVQAGGEGGNSFGAGGTTNSFGGGPIFGGSAGAAGEASAGGGGFSGTSSGGTGGSWGGIGGSDPEGAGGSICTPSCAGRQCGPDPVCGVSCGVCTPDSQCTPHGQCQEICSDTWSKTLLGMTGVGQIRLVDGKAYTVGHKSGVPWVGALSVCSGALVHEASAPIPGSDSSALEGISFANGTFHAVGTIALTGGDSGDGLYLNLDKSLHVLFGTPLFGSTHYDLLSSVAVGPSGNLWFGGFANWNGTPGSAQTWLVKGLPESQKYCGFPGGGGENSVGRSVVMDGTSVWLAGASEGQGYLRRFLDASCGAGDPCGCQPSDKIQVKAGEAFSEIRSVLAWQGALYVAGFGSDGGDIFGFAARVSPTTLSVEDIYRWNPTAEVDVLLDLATDGTRLFLVGGRGWKGEDDLSSAQGAVVALPLGFSSSSPPDWSQVLPAARTFFGVAASSVEGVLLSGKSAAGIVIRCTTNGSCP